MLIKLKKVIMAILVLFIICLVGQAPIYAEAAESVAEGSCGTNVTWSLDNAGILTISGEGSMENFKNAGYIPWYEYRKEIVSVVIEEGVTRIGDIAFYECSNLCSVEIPESVTGIEDSVFKYCTSLTTIELPETLQSIGSYTFSYCSGLTDISIPDNVAYMYYSSFAGCSSLESVKLSNNLKYIDTGMFGSCVSLKSIEIPDSVEIICDGVFSGCTSLESIEIPANVGEIYERAFYNCTNLSKIDFCGNAPTFDGTLIFNGVTAECYYPADNSTWSESVMQNYGGTLTWIEAQDTASGNCGAEGSNLTWTVYDDGILSIVGSGKMLDYTAEDSPWYSYRENIQAILIDEGVENIGAYAFYDCNIVERVELPESLVEIGEYAFYKCSSISDLELPESISEIEEHAFELCGSLESIQIPEKITNIADFLFGSCSGLESVSLSGSITEIGESAFEYCENLKSIEVPENVKNIEENAFYACTNLSEVKFKGNLPAFNGESIFFNVVVNCLYHAKNDTWKDAVLLNYGGTITWETYGIVASGECGDSGDNLVWFLYDDGELEINGSGEMANYSNSQAPWRGQSAAVTSLNMSEGITSLGHFAFYSLSQLTSVTLPDSIEKIGSYTFGMCSSLSTIEFSDNLLVIGDYAFSTCSSLAELEFNDQLTEIGEGTFYRCYNLEKIVVPPSLKKIGIIAFEECNALAGVYITDVAAWCGMEFEDSTANPLYYSTTAGPSAERVFFYIDGELAKDIVIPESVSKINDFVFYNCHYLNSVEISEGVTEIGRYAFWNCSRIKNITIPNSLKYVGENAFLNDNAVVGVHINDLISWCNIDFENREANPFSYSYEASFYMDGKMITEVIVPEEITEIKNYTFYSVDAESILLHENVQKIGIRAFGSVGVKELIIPDSVSFIAEEAFFNSNIEKITLPQGINCISAYAFSNCKSLMEVEIPENVSDIADYAFGNCEMLTDIIIPENVTNIGANAFEGCSSIVSFSLGSNVQKIGKGAFVNCSALKNVYITDLDAWCEIEFENAYSTPMSYAENLYLNNEILTEANISESLSEIKNYTFYQCSFLETIVIPDSVKRIGEYSFYECGDLQNVEIPENVTDIGEYAFGQCVGLQEIEIPEKVTNIGNYAFCACQNLKTLKLPDNGINMGVYAFAYTSLEEVDIPASITSLPMNLFRDCQNLSTVRFWGDAPSYIDSIAFQNVTATCYYPDLNETWTEDIMLDYGGDLTWVVWNAESDDENIGDGEGGSGGGGTGEGTGENTEGTDSGTGEGSGSGGTGVGSDSETGSGETGNAGSDGESSGEESGGNTGESGEGSGSGESGGTGTGEEGSGSGTYTFVINKHPENQSAKSGENAVFTVEATGEGLIYRWQYSNSNGKYWYDSGMAGAATESLTVPVLKKRDGQMYRCMVKDAYGNKLYSEVAVLTLYEETTIAIVTQPKSQTAANGTNAVFIIEAEGEGLTYQWQYSTSGGKYWFDSGMEGATTASLTLPVLDKRNGQQYRCVITDVNGNEVASEVAVLTVGEVCKIVSQPESQTVSVGENAAFTVEAEGEGLIYQWQYSKNGTYWFDSGMEGATTSGLVVGGLAKRNGQQYRCIVKDAGGNEAISTIAILYVN